MPEQLSSADAQLQQDMASFIAAQPTLAEDRLDAATAEQILAASKAAGFFQMTQPKEFGGSAASNLQLCLLRDELASHNTGFGHLVFGPGPGVLGGCDEPLKSNYLEPVLQGLKRGSFGFTEPDDAPQPTSATIEGDSLVINGQKSYVTGGNSADFINTLVRVEGKPTVVVIDVATPGVNKSRVFTSLDGSSHAAFTFTDVRVPTSHCIGKPGDGMPRAMGQIGDTRLAIAAQCVGLMRWTLNYLAEHLASPDRSGQPRSNSDVMRLRFGELRVQAYAARSMLYRTARLADSGENAINEGIYCKIFSTNALTEIVDSSIQLVGGNAVVEGHPLAKLYREVRSLRLAEGATDVLLGNIARGYFELGKGRL